MLSWMAPGVSRHPSGVGGRDFNEVYFTDVHPR